MCIKGCLGCKWILTQMAIEHDASPKHRQTNKFLGFGKFYGMILTDKGLILLVYSRGGGGQLVDFYDGGDHVHIWGLKFRKDEHIWGLRF